MLLNHTTTLDKLGSIRKYGLLASYSRQKRAAVWFHTRATDAWGETHVRMNHDAAAAEIVHITFDVPKSRLLRHGKGLYYVMGDVGADRIRAISLVRRTVEALPL